MIEFKNVSKAFNSKKVLNGVSGRFLPGKVNLVIGSSGAGKSVLVKCIVGLIHADQGSVTFAGKHFLDAPRGEKASTSIRREM